MAYCYGWFEMRRTPSKETLCANTLCCSVVTASIFSYMLADLAAHQDVLKAVRTEIRIRHAAIGRCWDMAAPSNLDDLESSTNEAARSLPVLKMPGHEHTTDPAPFETPDSGQAWRSPR
ncbi:hypothetical protein F5B22DRAFT_566476 [Xylaria bambusicola]|uniref:uncharacterized protein n=1 Tax=Xylaria bambusicola TaxID=326684 RepID=UPI0020088D52|nr:uncharacterized protein F5B22DRAFT_566476 [Xylaria bambusicola]KAI0521230.1 hypothetical protein F5B22DRAFT_566476 [Xylaria bambusicola]